MCLLILASGEQRVRETGQYFNTHIIYHLYIYQNSGNAACLKNISLLISIFIVCLLILASEKKVRETGEYFSAVIICLICLSKLGNIGTEEYSATYFYLHYVSLYTCLRGAEGEGDWTIFQCPYHLSLVYLSQ